MDLIREENLIKTNIEVDKHKKQNFLNDVSVLKKKKNIILQGPPGVGKTFAARRLAYSIMKEKDDDRIEFVQFQQRFYAWI